MFGNFDHAKVRMFEVVRVRARSRFMARVFSWSRQHRHITDKTIDQGHHMDSHLENLRAQREYLRLKGDRIVQFDGLIAFLAAGSIAVSLSFYADLRAMRIIDDHSMLVNSWGALWVALTTSVFGIYYTNQMQRIAWMQDNDHGRGTHGERAVDRAQEKWSEAGGWSGLLAPLVHLARAVSVFSFLAGLGCLLVFASDHLI